MSFGALTSFLTPVRTGFFLSVVVVGVFIAMAAQRNCVILDTEVLQCTTNWQKFWASSPNEVGDTLAGFAGALAFIWIVVTAWLQSSELAEQREVLREQKEEFKQMVAAQNAQVRALQAQADIFDDEKRVRRQSEVSQLFKSLLYQLCEFLERHPTISWRLEKARERTASVSRRRLSDGPADWFPQRERNLSEVHVWTPSFPLKLRKRNLQPEDYLPLQFENMLKVLTQLKLSDAQTSLVDCANEALKGYGIREKLQIINRLESQMSLADRVKLDAMGTKGAAVIYDEICSLPVWKDANLSEFLTDEETP